MISSRNFNYNTQLHASSIIKDYCKWNLQTFIYNHQLESNEIYAPFQFANVEVMMRRFRQLKEESFFTDMLKNGHRAILEYLHNFLNPENGKGYTWKKMIDIGQKLNKCSHKSLSRTQTILLFRQLTQWGYIRRYRENCRATYNTYLTTIGYVYLVDYWCEHGGKKKK